MGHGKEFSLMHIIWYLSAIRQGDHQLIENFQFKYKKISSYKMHETYIIR